MAEIEKMRREYDKLGAKSKKASSANFSPENFWLISPPPKPKQTQAAPPTPFTGSGVVVKGFV